MAIDAFMAHVEAEGFDGIVPGKGDVLGDQWSRAIGDLFDRTANAEGLEKGEQRHKVWLLWQWLYCLLAGQQSRTIASPPALRAAGLKIEQDDIDQATAMMLASQKYLD